MTPQRNGSNGWMVRLAAFLFVVQAALLGFSLGATADPLPRDQFGNVLCVSDGEGGNHKTSDKSGHHSGLMDCCSLGCGMFGSPGAPPPMLASLLVRQPVALSMPFVLFEDVGSGAVETPRNTRGPPLPA